MSFEHLLPLNVRIRLIYVTIILIGGTYTCTNILLSSSRVFQRLIFEQMHVPKEKKAKKQKRPLKSKSRDKRQCSLTERLMIPVHEYDVEVFHMLLQFVHTGTAYVTQQNVSGEFANDRLTI